MRSCRRAIHLLTLLIAFAIPACSPIYVLRAGYEEAKILSRRRPIRDVIADHATTPETRGRLELVLQARAFAQNQLGLDAGESFTTYSWVDSDTLLMVLSAARKDRFELHSWWFPIVGRVPYKGYFDFAEAARAVVDFEKRGYDAHIRPSGAFSTLGWFNDPVLNTVLRYGEVSLASTVIHELTHNTLFVPSQVSFNESFANFIGDRGAILFFCTRDGETDRRCRLARDLWSDNLVYGAFLSDLVARLEQVYGDSSLSTARKLEEREKVFQASRTRFKNDVQPQLKTRSYAGFADEPLSNATLIATRIYYERLDLFDRLFEKLGGDLPATLRALEELARKSPKDPFGALERAAS